MWDKLLKYNPSRKFLFAVLALIVVTILWIIKNFDAATYKDLIIALSGGFFVSQAAVDWKSKQMGQPPAPGDNP